MTDTITLSGLTPQVVTLSAVAIPGPIGPVGPQGIQGIPGASIKGDTGATGPVGSIGLQGNVGATGPVGPQGAIGPQGQAAPSYVQGSGITISGTTIAVDTSTIATLLALSNGLAAKANLSHTHDAADVTSGVLASARIPGLDASKIASGVLDIARIPVLPSQTVQVSSGDLTALTSSQQSAITIGTVVTTTDGSRYVYSGSGDKTVAGSYIILADITPDWSTVSSKPTFATVATSGSYADLSNKPTTTANTWTAKQTYTAGLSVALGGNTFNFNSGASSITPNISLGTTSGKSVALVAGSNGAAFTFDSSGVFSISADTKSNIDGGSTNGGTTYMTVSPASTTIKNKLVTTASTTSVAGLNVAPGVAPTSPIAGDIWTTSMGAFAQINGVTLPLNNSALLGVANTWNAAQTFAAKVATTASTATTAGLNLPHGTAPSSPINGDIWTTSLGAFAQVNGATVPLSGGSTNANFPFFEGIVNAGSNGSGGLPLNANSFAVAPINTVATDTHNGWNSTNYAYTVPQTGLYDILFKFRINDQQFRDQSYGIGVDTTVGDSANFSWYLGTPLRQGASYRRLYRFSAGDILKPIYYLDSFNATLINADLVIMRIF